MAKQSANSWGEVAGRAAVTDHRVLLVRPVQLPADKIAILVGLKVRHTYDDRFGSKAAAKVATPSAMRVTK